MLWRGFESPKFDLELNSQVRCRLPGLRSAGRPAQLNLYTFDDRRLPDKCNKGVKI
jgi:hypothetical protein